jgi:broad specificity phosphatase PhoE
MTVRLAILRHGETEMNSRALMQGYGADYPLNERGRRQAERAAARLTGAGITAIFSSDLPRALETAEIVAAEVGHEVRCDPRLREQDIGDWEGRSWPDVTAEEVRAMRGDLDFAPGGGESRRQVRDRVRPLIAELAGGTGGDYPLVVSHGGVLIAMMHDLLDIHCSPRPRFYGSNCGLTEFVWDGDVFRLTTFDETHYLDGV